MSKQVLGMGPAPVLENSEVAVSIHLTQKGADILWATFDTPAPDFTLSFEMDLEGFKEPQRAKVVANLDEMYKHQVFEAAATTPVLSAELKAAFDEMVESKTIEVSQIALDDKMEAILNTVYTKLTNLLFNRVENNSLNQLQKTQEGKSMFDRASQALEKARKEAMLENEKIEKRRKEILARNEEVKKKGKNARDKKLAKEGKKIDPPEGNQKKESKSEKENSQLPELLDVPKYAVALSYTLKKSKKSGKYQVDLNKYTSVIQTIPFVSNVGNIDCGKCFKRVRLDDPLYKQRDIHAFVDGMNSEDFGSYINFVNLLLKKKHQNGDVSVEEILIDRNRFNQDANDFVMQYGFKDGDNLEDWLGFEVKTLWSFFGGHEVKEEWEELDFAGIPLTPPLIKKPVYIEIDPDFAAEENLRGVEVKLDYTVGNKKQSKRVRLLASNGELSHTEELLLPLGVDEYCYQVTWFVKGIPPVISNKVVSEYGLIYLESLPEEL